MRWVRFPYRLPRFVSVMVNMFDCLSNAMGSIPIQTAGELLNGATVSISDFDSDDIGSNPVSTTNGGISLSAKRPSVQRRNRVRFPMLTPADL
jgi:hypothetical protein